VIAVVRATVGSTRPGEATPGSIRADFGLMVGRTLVHASDGPDTARQELALWFTDAEMSQYGRDIDRWVLE
jgi:nucleoside-diphosphate kinase